MTWIMGVDVGGTFTDFYALNTVDRRVILHKTPSTPDNPARAIIEGCRTLCAANAIDVRSILRLCHGTTVATNALIERRGGRVALITTEGFRDLIEIGRQIRPHLYDLQQDYPVPLVPRELRFEVAERMSAAGAPIKALTEDAIASAVRQVVESNVDACAICLLFSFINPVHERRLSEALHAAAPNLYVSISSAVQPEFREYERLSTTVLNAYLQPVMADYLGHLETEFQKAAPKSMVGINQSIGGLMSVERARTFPIRTALSGPAAGAMGAIYSAQLSNRPDVITLDMGGTSADVALIRDFQTGTNSDRYLEGFPVRMPSVDINSVGAGGGSIAWFERDGLLKVGPASAGAVPGPACYGKGGDRPTVSDANLVLGRLSPDGLLGGKMPLQVEAARAVLAPVAERLGFTIEHAAQGVLSIVVSNMVRAIRAISVERGHDPRKFALLPFGGAGPLHASDVARSLGIREIVVPLAPGILCAQGLVVSDLKESFVRTRRTRLDQDGAPTIARILDELRAEARAWFVAERVAEADRIIRGALEMRYVGQNFELSVPLNAEELTNLDIEIVRQRFFKVHEANYGYCNPQDPVDIINYRLTGLGRLSRPKPQPSTIGISGAAVPIARRRIFFDAAVAMESAVYDRSTLRPGHELVGPAVVEQFDSTTLLYPGNRARVDQALNLIIEVAL